MDQAILHGVGEGAHQQQLPFSAAGQQRHQCRQRSILPLGEGGFDAAAGVVHHSHTALQFVVKPLCRPGQVQLDHLTGAGSHQKQGADLWSPLQQFPGHTVQFLMGVRQARQIPLAENGGAKTGFGKDHHAGGALDQVCAGP